MMKKGIISCLAVLSAIICALPAFAASTFTLSPSGEGVFTLQGIGVEGAGGIEVTIAYDAASLGNPRAELGGLVSGAMMAANPNVPGTLRMAIIRISPIQGSGVVAVISFDRKGGGAGKINSLSVRLSSVDGKPLPAIVNFTNPPDARESAADASRDAGTPATAPPTSAGSTPPTSVIITGRPATEADDTVQPEHSDAADRADEPVSADADQATSDETPALARRSDRARGADEATERRNIFSPKSVLERFREYKGEPTVKALISLFEQDSLIGFRQEPPVALSTRGSAVRAVFITTPGSKSPSDLAVMGARLLSLKSDPDYTNTWIAELAPVAGGYSASLTVPQEKISIIYPLTVAPKADVDLDGSGSVTEADFALFLKKRGSAKEPLFDLNKDGKRNFLDDYIFTVNYLVAISR
jgi:hypothetical protein